MESHDDLEEAQTYFDEVVGKLEAESIQFQTLPTSSRLSHPRTVGMFFTGFNKNDKAELMSKAG